MKTPSPAAADTAPFILAFNATQAAEVMLLLRERTGTSVDLILELLHKEYVRSVDAQDMPVLHLLEEGLPRCRFTYAMPKDWPVKQFWVPTLAEANCKFCLEATQPVACTAGGPPCCDRRNEYNGFGSGPRTFDCPKKCPCHD